MHGPFIFRLRDERPCRWFETVEDLQPQIKDVMRYTTPENVVILERMHTTQDGQELWRQLETSQVLEALGR